MTNYSDKKIYIHIMYIIMYIFSLYSLCSLYTGDQAVCIYRTVCVDMDTYYITTKSSLVTSRIPCVTTHTTKYAAYTCCVRPYPVHTQMHTPSFSRRANELRFGIYTHGWRNNDSQLIRSDCALYNIYVQYKRWLHGKQTNACFE